jgi:hypothetical protein
VPPAAGDPVIDRPGGLATRAAQPATAAAHHHDDPGRAELDPATSAPGMASILLHAVLARTRRSRGPRSAWQLRNLKDGACASYSSSPAQLDSLPLNPTMLAQPTIQPTETRGVPVFAGQPQFESPATSALFSKATVRGSNPWRRTTNIPQVIPRPRRVMLVRPRAWASSAWMASSTGSLRPSYFSTEPWTPSRPGPAPGAGQRRRDRRQPRPTSGSRRRGSHGDHG